MLDPRVTFTMDDLLLVPADTLVIEDSGWLTASRGSAATLDRLYPSLRRQREQVIEAHGGPLEIGSAIAFALPPPYQSEHKYVVWAVTYSYQREEMTPTTSQQRVRATPLAVTAAAQNALKHAAKVQARHVVMPALGTRAERHVLPPVPKKLPRYVMGAAQLAGIQHALATIESIAQVTVSLSQRDYGIFQELLGRPASDLVEERTIDE